MAAFDNTELANTNIQNNLKLHIDIEKFGQNPTKISFPLSTVKSLARIGNGISGILGNGCIDGIKLDEILVLAESGVVGELMDMVSDDNTHIVISVR